MNEQEGIAYVQAMAIGGLIEAMGMMALNQYRIQRDETPAYDDTHFHKLMEERGLHHNAIITNLTGNQ